MIGFGRSLLHAVRLVGHVDPELVGILALSVRVSLSAAVVGFLIGAPLGASLVVAKIRGRQALVVITNALLGLPPVVVGLILYLVLSHSGPLGSLGMLFTPDAMILAQSVLALPIVVALVHRGLIPLWRDYGDALLMDGASRARVGLELLRMGRGVLLTAFLAAFGRAVSEVGAILIVGGNIRGFTRTMTTAVALETSKGDLPLALALGLVLIGLSLVVSATAFAVEGWTRHS
jgi:tungstate transport system permease protein